MSSSSCHPTTWQTMNEAGETKNGDHLIPVWLIPGLNHQMYHVPIIIHPFLLQLTINFMSNKKTTLGSP